MRSHVLAVAIALVACLASVNALPTTFGKSQVQLTTGVTVAQDASHRGLVVLGDSIYYCSGSDVYKTVTLTGESAKFYTNAASLGGCRGLRFDTAGKYLYVNGGATVFRIDATNPGSAAVDMWSDVTTTSPFDQTNAALAPVLVGLASDGVDNLYVWNNNANTQNNKLWKLAAGAAGTPGKWTAIDVTGETISALAVDSIAAVYTAGSAATHIVRAQAVQAGADSSTSMALISLASTPSIVTVNDWYNMLNIVGFPDYTPIDIVVTQVDASKITFYLLADHAGQVSLDMTQSPPVFSEKDNGALTLDDGMVYPWSIGYDPKYGTLVAVGNNNKLYQMTSLDLANGEMATTVVKAGGDAVTIDVNFDRAILTDTTWTVALQDSTQGTITGSPVTMPAGTTKFQFQFQPWAADQGAATATVVFTQTTSAVVGNVPSGSIKITASGSTTNNAASATATNLDVTVTLTLTHAPPTDLTATLSCFSDSARQVAAGTVSGPASFTSGGAVAQSVTYTPADFNAVVYCKWVFSGTDGDFFTADPFTMTIGTPATITLSHFPAAMLPSSTVEVTVTIPSSVTSQVTVTPNVISGDATVTGSAANFGSPAPTTFTITTGTQVGTVKIGFSLTGSGVAALADKTFVTVNAVSVVITPPASLVYTGTPISLGIAPNESIPADVTVTATCDAGVTLAANSLTFTAGSTSRQSFLLTPPSSFVVGSNAVSCTFAVTGDGSNVVSPVDELHFAITIPAKSSSTGGGSQSQTSSTGGNNNNGLSSTGDDFCADCAAMTAASLPSMALYAILLLAARAVVRA